MSNKIKYHKLSEKFHAQNKTPVNTIPISSFIVTYHLQQATVISENISISKGKKNPPLFFQILTRNIFYRMSGEEKVGRYLRGGLMMSKHHQSPPAIKTLFKFHFYSVTAVF